MILELAMKQFPQSAESEMQFQSNRQIQDLLRIMEAAQ